MPAGKKELPSKPTQHRRSESDNPHSRNNNYFNLEMVVGKKDGKKSMVDRSQLLNQRMTAKFLKRINKSELFQV